METFPLFTLTAAEELCPAQKNGIHKLLKRLKIDYMTFQDSEITNGKMP